MNLEALAAGGALGFIASVLAIYLWNVLDAPNLVAESVQHDDVQYMVDKNPEGAEVRLLTTLFIAPVQPELINPTATTTATWSPPDTATEKSVSFYRLDVRNAPCRDWLRRRLAREMAWAARARVSFRQFIPGSTTRSAQLKAFTFFGRWISTPEPTIPTQQEIQRAQRIDMPHDRMEGLSLALKIDGEDSAWGFSNDSYYYARTGRGLWRHPDYEMTLGSHFRISIRFETTNTSREFLFHANNTGRGTRDLIIHAWHGCQDCSG